MQTHRLFEIIYILLTDQKVTAKNLSEHCQVSIRTIYRDIDRLSQAGIPIYTQKGNGGGVSLLSNFVLDKVLLTQKEKQSILQALQTQRALDIDDSSDDTLKKLSALFGHVSEPWLSVDLSRWYDTVDHFEEIKAAILAQQQISFAYYNAKGECFDREVEPIQLVFKSMSWYLNADLSVLGSVYSTLAYLDRPLVLTKGATGEGNLDKIGSVFGLSHVKRYKLADDTKDDDVSDIVIGHRKLTYKGKEKEVIVLAVRGTNGTVNEWSSNFDVGADTADYWDQANQQWTNKANHKGFDVTTNRLKAKVDAYIKQYVTAEPQNQIYYVTGHSRGAALGNLLAKAMVDSYSQSKVFSYTFATPNNTTSASATSKEYKGLFSIINTDDIIPQMPLKDWGFTNYGQIREISVADKYEGNKILGLGIKEGTFEWLTGRDYNNDGRTYRSLNSFGKLANDRNDLYKYGEGIGGLSTFIFLKESEQDYYAKIGKRLSRHVRVSKVIPISGLDLVNAAFQTPAFLMQDLANFAGGEKDYPLTGRLVAAKYTYAKFSFAQTSSFGNKFPLIGGMAHPHLPQTYYLIAKNNFVALS